MRDPVPAGTYAGSSPALKSAPAPGLPKTDLQNRDLQNPALQNEDQFCLLLARGTITPDVRRRILKLLASPLNWPVVLQRAYDHQVYPLLFRNLRDLGFPNIPEAVQSDLKGLFVSNALRNQLLAEELGRLLGLLGAAGIRVIPLKGITLAQSLFGDPSARVCSDIDILVPPGEVVAARRALLANGYSSQFTEEFFIKHQLHTTADCTLIPQNGPLECLLEVHWTLMPDSSRDAEAVAELWAQSKPADYFGICAWSLTPEWQFLYLSVHAAYHKWNTLKWLADIHQLCVSVPTDSAPIDWSKVKAYAETYELEAVAEPTLAACSALFGTPVPANLNSRSFPADVRLFPDSLDSTASWNATLFYPRLLKRRSEKIRWLFQSFFVPKIADHRFIRLPRYLTFLYYVLRPLRLTVKWSWLFLSAAFARMMGKK